MKRYGKNTLTQGMRIRYSGSDRIYSGSPKIIDGIYGDVIGYITYDLFMSMCRAKTIVKEFGDYWYAEYVVQ